MDCSCVENETRFVTKNCAKLGTRRKEKEWSSERNMEENSRKREKSNVKGETCLQQFTKWLDYLVEETRRPLTVLAHNFQGYDSYPPRGGIPPSETGVGTDPEWGQDPAIEGGGHSLH